MKLRVISNGPLFQTNSNDSHTYMAANRIAPDEVLLRRLPDNAIVSVLLKAADDGYSACEEIPLVSVARFPLTRDGQPVIGYEDPTYVSGGGLFGSSILATQVYARPDGQPGVIANLVAYDCSNQSLCQVLTPSDLRHRGIPNVTDMVKEGEVLNATTLLFEYTAGGHSHIGIGRIDDDGDVASVRPFLTAQADGSEHVSTAGAPVSLPDGRQLIFFNRRRDNEWGITCMITDSVWNVLSVGPDFILRADPESGRGPGDQLIAFASGVYARPDGIIEVLYHVNDNSCHRAELLLDA